MRPTSLAAAVALLALLAACNADGGSQPPSGTPVGQVEIAVSVTVDRQEYRPGDPVVMSIGITNRSGQTVELEYSDSQRYDFRVADAAGREVWRWAEDKLFAQVIGWERLGPGESLQYAETWDQTDAQGVPLPPGEYTLEGTSPFCLTSDKSAGCNADWTEGPQITISAGGRY